MGLLFDLHRVPSPGGEQSHVLRRPPIVEQCDGLVQVFRRANSPYESVRLKLRGLEPEAKYQITRLDRSEKLDMNGEELMQKGLPVAIDERPGVAIIKYQLVSARKE